MDRWTMCARTVLQGRALHGCQQGIAGCHDWSEGGRALQDQRSKKPRRVEEMAKATRRASRILFEVTSGLNIQVGLQLLIVMMKLGKVLQQHPIASGATS